MEREGRDPEFLKRISEKDQEKAKVMDEIVFKFEKGLIDVMTGRVNTADLFSGDFFYQEKPLEIILPANGKTLNIDYSELFSRFMEFIQNDLIGEFNTLVIKKNPEARTKNLEDFIKYHPHDYLTVIQSSRKLKSEQDSILYLTLDRYLQPKNSKIPFSETWTLRRMKLDTQGDIDSQLNKKYKILPRSMISKQNIPALPSGK